MGSAILVQSSSEDFRYMLHVEFIANVRETSNILGLGMDLVYVVEPPERRLLMCHRPA